MIRIIIYLMKLIIALIVAILFSSCHHTIHFGDGIKGNGNLITQTRNVSQDFDKIQSSQGILVIVEQARQNSITVLADDNIVDHIITRIENGTLFVETDEGFNANNQPTVNVKMPTITALKSSSASTIKSNSTLITENITVKSSSGSEINIDVEADFISVETSSGSSVNVSGKALKLETASSSGSTLDATNLLVNDVYAQSSSGSSTTVNPIINLSAKASSGSSIAFKNDPKMISKEESSGGSISRK